MHSYINFMLPIAVTSTFVRILATSTKQVVLQIQAFTTLTFSNNEVDTFPLHLPMSKPTFSYRAQIYKCPTASLGTFNPGLGDLEYPGIVA